MYIQQGISGADSYEPTGTYDTLQKNLGQDARTALHQKEALHETSSWRCGGCDFAADSAHGDPHSDSEAIRAGGETYCLETDRQLPDCGDGHINSVAAGQ